jgi:hypothetical protein
MAKTPKTPKNSDGDNSNEAKVPLDNIPQSDIAAVRVEPVADGDVNAIRVSKPDANAVVKVNLVAGRTVQLDFRFDEVSALRMDENGQDLILKISGGGEVVFQNYVNILSMSTGINTKVVDASGKTSDLQSFLSVVKPGGGDNNKTDVPDTPADDPQVNTVPAPADGQNLVIDVRGWTPGKPVRFGFSSKDVYRRSDEADDLQIYLDRNGDGIPDGQVTLRGFGEWARLGGVSFRYSDGVRESFESFLERIEPTAGGEESGAFYTVFAPGDLGPGIDNLGPLGDELLNFGTIDPDERLFPDSLSSLGGLGDDPTANPDFYAGPNARADLFNANAPCVPVGVQAVAGPCVPAPCAPLDLEVLANDSDPNPGDILTITHINGTAVVVGDMITTAGGNELTLDTSMLGDPTKLHKIIFNPGDCWGGTDSFTYTITDGNSGAPSSATVVVEVPAEWSISPAQTQVEGDSFDYALEFDGSMLGAGQTRSIDVTLDIDLPPSTGSR